MELLARLVQKLTVFPVWFLNIAESFKVLDVEGFERTVYTRQALRNLLIEVNNLPTDLRFWVEANR